MICSNDKFYHSTHFKGVENQSVSNGIRRWILFYKNCVILLSMKWYYSIFRYFNLLILQRKKGTFQKFHIFSNFFIFFKIFQFFQNFSLFLILSEIRTKIRNSMRRQIEKMVDRYSNKFKENKLKCQMVLFKNEKFLAKNIHLTKGSQLRRLAFTRK